MPYKSNTIKIQGTQHDRRCKLSAEQEQNICKDHRTQMISQKALAKKYGVSPRTIAFVLDPDKRKEVQELLKNKKKKGMYKTPSERRAKIMRDHRSYKNSLFTKELY